MKAGEGGTPPYTATCDKAWYSERQHTELTAFPGEALPSPSDRLRITAIKRGPFFPQHPRLLGEEAALTVGLYAADKHSHAGFL